LPEDEDITKAAALRLDEECGFCVALTTVGSFVYRARDASTDGSEHEFDTVLVGHAPANVQVRPNPAEIEDWKWVEVSALMDDLTQRPGRYAPWLKQALHLAASPDRTKE
jgi:isopentenyl-diphosphate delta-isomerase